MNVTRDVIFTFFSDYWLCKIPYKEISALYLLYGPNHSTRQPHGVNTPDDEIFFEGVWLYKIPYKEISALYLLYECIFFTHGYSRDIQKRKALLY